MLSVPGSDRKHYALTLFHSMRSRVLYGHLFRNTYVPTVFVDFIHHLPEHDTVRRRVFKTFGHNVKMYHFMQKNTLQLVLSGIEIIADAYRIVARSSGKEPPFGSPRHGTEPRPRHAGAQRRLRKLTVEVLPVEHFKPRLQLPCVRFHSRQFPKCHNVRNIPLQTKSVSHNVFFAVRCKCNVRKSRIMGYELLLCDQNQSFASDMAFIISPSISSQSSGLSFRRVFVASLPCANLLPW